MSLNNTSTETRKPQFKHLSLEERREIQLHLENGLSLRGIAKMLGRSVSTLSDEIKRDVKESLEEHGFSMFKSITWDNGSEFSLMSELECLSSSYDLKIYYAHAYSSWERGTNKNFNGLLREFVPKGVSIRNFRSRYPSL